MKAALCIVRVTEDVEANFRHIVDAILECPDDTDLVLFPESSITGLINNDDPSHDLPIGQPIPGEYTHILSEIAIERNMHIGIGMLEREGKKLYDSAILITPGGDIALKYRRMTHGWHGKKADPKVYCKGNELKKARTTLGTFAFLICGDLFSDELIAQIQGSRPDWILFPFARCFEDGNYDQKRWEEERRYYIERVKLAGSTTLMVNYLAGKGSNCENFGGAMVVSPMGEIIAEMPIGKEGELYVEI